MSIKKLLHIIGIVALLTVMIFDQSQADSGLPPFEPENPGPSQPAAQQQVDGIDEKLIPTVAEPVINASVTSGQSGISFRYTQTFATTGVPYNSDNDYLNKPFGLFIDANNNLFVAEMKGNRIIKYDSNSTVVATYGQTGAPWAQENFLANVRDVATDSSGNVWSVNQPFVKQTSSAGVLIQTIPPTDPGNAGNDDYHFQNPQGLAFDASGNLFVSDTDNHRIQIYSLAGGTASYVHTIGETGVIHTDNNGFNFPGKLAFDSSGRLYVVDTGNYRVQRCTFGTSWTCELFYGVTGVPGTDLAHMKKSVGITIDINDKVYIADGDNYRVLKCNTDPTNCAITVGADRIQGSGDYQLWWPSDVAVDSFLNVYISDDDNHRVQKYNEFGVLQETFGTTSVPYLTSPGYLNTPWGIAVAPDKSMYIVENQGYRLVKYNAAGVQQWAIGQPGVYGTGNAKFGNWWSGLIGNPALDASGRVYVPDTSNGRVQIYNSNGTYYATLGTGLGTGQYQFNCVGGIAISPITADIYVTDRCNHRIQVFNSARVYKATLGVTGSAGTTNLLFRFPEGITVDKNGIIYVADTGNERVQKCTLSGTAYSCTTLTGVPGAISGAYNVVKPRAVATDSLNRVYVVDESGQRVLVYEATGAYLTHMGGRWDTTTGGLRSPSGIAIDAFGDIYITDRENHRIQKFSPGLAGWIQTNINGFGDYLISVNSLATFGSYLYAGTAQSSTGAQLWRSSDGFAWQPVMSNGFGNIYNTSIDHLLVFNNQLYASTWANVSKGGEIWRSSDGVNWSSVVTQGFGNTLNSEIFRMYVYNGQIYATTWSGSALQGGEIWRSSTGNLGSWVQVTSNGFGDLENKSVVALEAFNGYLYAGTYNETTGGEMWRSTSGDVGTWTQISTDGFGSAENRIVTPAVFNGYLYASVYDPQGAQLWRCQVCNGTDWSVIVSDGFNDVDMKNISAMEVVDGYLYAIATNAATGLEVWRSADGLNWSEVITGGFGSSTTRTTYLDNGTTTFKGVLFVAGNQFGSGGQIWAKYSQTRTPAIGDFNGNGYAEAAVYRPSNGTWYIRGAGIPAKVWGIAGDIPVPADYNGDGKTDIAVYRPSNGTWYITGAGIPAKVWGIAGDIPVPADYNGDKKADIAVYRPSNGTWYISGAGIAATVWGIVNDVPVPGDYNGDGKAEIAVYRISNGTWYVRGVGNYVWGQIGDIPAPADFNGDKKSDVAVFRPSNNTWYIRGVGNFIYGLSGDIPVPANFTGTTAAEIAVYRPTTGLWDIRGLGSFIWGIPEDLPVSPEIFKEQAP